MSINGNMILDLVLPVYNEVAQLRTAIDRVLKAMVAQRLAWRIIVADNGSTDGTTALAEELSRICANVCCNHLDAKGRGRALRKAWIDSQAEFSLYMDVDLSTDLAAIPQALRLLREGADIVAGSRIGAESRTTRSLKREILSRGFNRLVRSVLGTRSFDDAQCGFKGIRVKTVRPLLSLVQNHDWFFDTELLVLAEYAGFSIRSLPVIWTEDPNTKVNIPKTVWQDLQGVARLWWTARRLAKDWIRNRNGEAVAGNEQMSHKDREGHEEVGSGQCAVGREVGTGTRGVRRGA